MKKANAKEETRWFVECPECGAEHDVDNQYDGQIECICDAKFEFDNSNSEVENEKFISALEEQINKAVNCIEIGNEYEGILGLKGIQLSFRIRRECT